MSGMWQKVGGGVVVVVWSQSLKQFGEVYGSVREYKAHATNE